MIKYNTTLGFEHLNKEAREMRDILKLSLNGMHCNTCISETVITFIDDGNHHLKYLINACCTAFEMSIRRKIKS